ncbi:hypothetical protein [Ferrimonas marina]|uniref:Uncharacterized protein n=1 Tax=Ferrimonas marina TaxID=299255 RepID=A0A1M5TWJ8_9GAMM|nr:hypothetical protein [Ferrimonas marina]SHH55074.1 hypothetical protein SAMN02745129_2304 [Ferrimonas marina]
MSAEMPTKVEGQDGINNKFTGGPVTATMGVRQTAELWQMLEQELKVLEETARKNAEWQLAAGYALSGVDWVEIVAGPQELGLGKRDRNWGRGTPLAVSRSVRDSVMTDKLGLDLVPQPDDACSRGMISNAFDEVFAYKLKHGLTQYRGTNLHPDEYDRQRKLKREQEAGLAR